MYQLRNRHLGVFFAQKCAESLVQMVHGHLLLGFASLAERVVDLELLVRSVQVLPKAHTCQWIKRGGPHDHSYRAHWELGCISRA